MISVGMQDEKICLLYVLGAVMEQNTRKPSEILIEFLTT